MKGEKKTIRGHTKWRCGEIEKGEEGKKKADNRKKGGGEKYKG